MAYSTNKTVPFNIKKSVEKASKPIKIVSEPETLYGDIPLSWANKLDRVLMIRRGIPYSAIEVLSERLNSPIKAFLSLIGIPQTTYNKKKSQHSRLDSRDSELIVMISEVLDFGLEVFNKEEAKFQRWIKKSNISLGGNTPESLFDTATGIDEVRFALNRIEYGNFA